MKIPVFDISLNSNEKKFIRDVIKKNNYTSGPYIKKFENEFGKINNSKFNISTSNGTNALHLCCKAIGIKEGDEVLVSSSTNMASAFSIIYCGGVPIPIDINNETWQIDPYLVEKKITKKTKAIMVVHLFGQSVEMDLILKIAKKYKLKIIEDCAEAHGVFYKNKHVGNFGDVAAYSFYFNKSITSGEGGMVSTNSKRIYEFVKSYKNLCYGKKERFLHSGVGFNYRLSNLHSSLGYGITKNFKNILKKKNSIYNYYVSKLKNIKGIDIPKISKNTSTYVMWVFNISLNNKFPLSRDELLKKLYKKGIETRKAFAPINYQEILIKKFKGKFNKSDCKNANYIMNNGFYLPSGNNIKKKEINFICDQIRLLSLK
jgi:perosamine synthetase